MIIHIYFRSVDCFNEKQIYSFLTPSLQKYHFVRSFSEASTVDPVALLDILSQTKNSQLPKDCFVECRNFFFFNILVLH